MTTEELQRWARVHYGTEAVVERVERMPGNAGISFGFDVVAGADRHRLVIRTPPPGVKRRGNNDVLRQAPVIRAAGASGVPVATVRWHGDDEQWFGVPYLIVDRIAGRSPDRWGTGDGTAPPITTGLVDQAVDALAAIHAIAWEDRLAGWSIPRSLTQEVAAWEPALAKADDPDFVRQGHELHDRLLATLPPEPEPAVVHGDYYANNWIVDGDRLAAVVDWEIADIGPPLLDLAWLCMTHDPDNWAPSLVPAPGSHIDPDKLVVRYEKATGQRVTDINWYRALAAWRFGAIIALNAHLHYSGRRPDPVWERMAESFPTLIARGLSFIENGR